MLNLNNVVMNDDKKDIPYVTVPRKMTESGKLEPKDLVIYAAIVRHKNKEDKAWPALATISAESGAAIGTVRKCIANLVANGYLSVEKHPKQSNVYTILKHIEGFEPFALEFLDDERLSFIEKAYYLAAQEYIYLDSEGKSGTIKFTNTELSKRINMPYSTLRKCQNSLEKKEFMYTVGNTKVYSVEEFNKAIVYKLKEHEDRITELEEENRKLKNDLKETKSELKEVRNEINEIKNTKITL